MILSKGGPFMSSIRTELKEMRLLELKLFVIEYNRASQLDRSISKKSSKAKSDFRKALLNICIDLFNQIDDRSIKNDKMKNAGIKNNKMISVSKKDYQKYQDKFAKEFEIRLFKDRAYDCQRIKNFIK